MLSFEFNEILCIFLVRVCLFIFRQGSIVFLFCGQSLMFERFLLSGREALPVFSHKFCDFREGQIAPFEVLAHFYHTVNYRLRRRHLDLLLENITYADGGRSGAFSSGYQSVSILKTNNL